MTPSDQHRHEMSLDEVCWALCSANYLERDNPVFPDECVFKLFRVFCMLGDMVENEETDKIEVRACLESANRPYVSFLPSSSTLRLHYITRVRLDSVISHERHKNPPPLSSPSV